MKREMIVDKRTKTERRKKGGLTTVNLVGYVIDEGKVKATKSPKLTLKLESIDEAEEYGLLPGARFTMTLETSQEKLAPGEDDVEEGEK